ncbi:MAG: hypothetical protein K0S49_2831, partial [Microbacterium sp.]|nr:hypothetical protein [Microbacterium sp.]
MTERRRLGPDRRSGRVGGCAADSLKRVSDEALTTAPVALDPAF